MVRTGDIANLGTLTQTGNITSAGTNVATGQPAFHVRPTSTQTDIAQTPTVIVFDDEVFDVGSNFASNTFTAPVTGKYQINVLMRVNDIDTAASSYQLNLVTSNREFVFIFDPGVDYTADAPFSSHAFGVCCDMDASDTAFMRIAYSDGTAQTDIHGGQAYFSGFLVA
jgi:hypothetical protein